MKTVLVINASPNPSDSYSRMLTERFVGLWKRHNPEDTFVFRELGNTDIPHVNQHWVKAAFTPEQARGAEDQQAIAFSDVLVKELQGADVIVLGSPMHNLSVPSTLKAYIDQVIRMGITTSLAPGTPGSPYIGLLKNKKAYLLLVQGGYGFGKGEMYEHMDFQQPYLKAILQMLGVTDVTTVKMNHTTMSKELRLDSYTDAQTQGGCRS
ncbi:FMN-dependent NADH-azoreductase [Pseudomonas paeninsulae]|uniref:FMN-dependent NADH-azoreductase n=1 Tax=Pseudomonas paeninsulae TaxID=3110772 RepID=UPI002D7973DA|nr:NAD(P)H-dependent oxidoreductase [Pseudomonas sp. IT1137]